MAVSASGSGSRPSAGPADSDAVGALRARINALDASLAHVAQLTAALADPADAPRASPADRLAPQALPPGTSSARPAAYVVPALAPDGPVGIPLSAFPGQAPHPRNNPEGTRRIYPSYAAARAALAKQATALSQEREQVRKLIFDHASSALRSALGLIAGQGPGGEGSPDIDLNRKTEDGLPFVDPVERLPDENSSVDDKTPVSAWSSLKGGAATIAPFKPQVSDAETRRRWIEQVFAQAGDDDDEEEDKPDEPQTPPQSHPQLPPEEAKPQDPPSSTDSRHTATVTQIPMSPELRPLPHSADLPPPPKPALKRKSSYSASPIGGGTPTGLWPGRAGSISMANLPGHAAHPLSIPDHDGLSWQPPPKAFGASGFKRGFLNLNPHSEGAKHSSDAVSGPSVWEREVETVHSCPASPSKEVEKTPANSSPEPAEGEESRGRSPSCSSAAGTKHVRIVSPSPSQRWHSHIWDEHKAALSLGKQRQEQATNNADESPDLSRPLRSLKVSLPTDDDLKKAENMQVVLARPRPEPHPVPDVTPLLPPPPTRMAKDEPDEDVTDEAAKIIALLGADSIAAQVGGVAVPGSSAAAAPISDGAGGLALPRRPVAEPSAAPAPKPSARPALGRDVVERTPGKRLPPKRPARRTSASAPVPTPSAAQAHADAAALPAPVLPAPPADLDEIEAVPSLSTSHRVHPSPTPYPTPPVTGTSSPVGEIPAGGFPFFRPLPSVTPTPKPKKRSLFGGFLKLNSAATSAESSAPASDSPPASSVQPTESKPGPEPESRPAPEPAAEPQSTPESKPISESETRPQLEPESEHKSEPNLPSPLAPTPEEGKASVPNGSPTEEVEGATQTTAREQEPGAEESGSDESGSEAALAKRIREVGPTTSVGVSALDRAVLAEEATEGGVKPPHARPTKAYAAALARRRRSAEGTGNAASSQPSGGVSEESEVEAASPTANKPRRGSKVRFDLADEEYRDSPPGSPGPSPARLGGKSDTVRRVRFAASNRAYRAPEQEAAPLPVAGDDAEARPPKIKRKAIIGTTPDGQPILRGRGQIRFTTSSDEAGSQSDKQTEDNKPVVRGRGKIRFATSSEEAEAHSGEDGYDTDPPPAEMVRRAHSGESPGEALRAARERAVSITKAASSSSFLDDDTSERVAEEDVEGANESVGAAADDEQDLGSDEDEEDDDDPMLSEEEYTAEDLASLMPSFDQEWGEHDDDEDDDDGDLDSALQLAEIQREYARIKSGILADRHRWTVALSKDDHPLDPSTGEAITTAPSSLVPADAGSSGGDGKSKSSRFKQERVARAFAAHAAAEAGAPSSAASLGQGSGLPEGQMGKPIMVIPHLAPIRSTPTGAPVEEKDLTSTRGVDLEGDSDEEDDRLLQMAKERFGLAVAPGGVVGASVAELPDTPPAEPKPEPELAAADGLPHPSTAPASATPAPTTEVGAVLERSSRPPNIGRARSQGASASNGPSGPVATDATTEAAVAPAAAPAPAKRMSRFKAERMGLR